MTLKLKPSSKMSENSDWVEMNVRDDDHKRWNNIVGGDVCNLEVKGHPDNKSVSVFLEEFWVTEKNRHMSRAIHMQLDEEHTRHLYETLKKVLNEN